LRALIIDGTCRASLGPRTGASGLRDLSRFDFSDEIMLVHDILARRFN